jgi:hypothetical protein
MPSITNCCLVMGLSQASQISPSAGSPQNRTPYKVPKVNSQIWSKLTIRGFSRTVECERRAQILDRSPAQALLVVPGLPLGIPDLEAVNVKTKRSPIIRANQAHPVSRGDREPAPIAGMSEAVTVPQLNRSVTRKVAVFDPVPNEVPNGIGDHIEQLAY